MNTTVLPATGLSVAAASVTTVDPDRNRCAWGNSAPEYVTYHDEEWGVPVLDDRKWYEKIVLDGAQAGLSWLTVNLGANFIGFRNIDGLPYRATLEELAAPQIQVKDPDSIPLASGIGSYDFVPTKLVATTFIKSASDDWFADFNGTGIPTMAIGRIPARTAAQASSGRSCSAMPLTGATVGKRQSSRPPTTSSTSIGSIPARPMTSICA